MNVLEVGQKRASVTFSVDELDAMRNGLNEARLLLKGRGGHDFATRIGMSVKDASELIRSLQSLIGDIDDASRGALTGESQAKIESAS